MVDQNNALLIGGRWPRSVAQVMLLTGLFMFVSGCVSDPLPYASWHKQLVADNPRVAAVTNLPLDGLNADAAVCFALAHNPELSVLRAAVTVARADSRAAGDLTNPELRGDFGTQHTSAEGPDMLATARSMANGTFSPLVDRNPASDKLSRNLAIRFFPPNPWTRKARISAADAMAQAAEANMRAAAWRVTSGVRRIFEDVSQSRQMLVMLDQSVAIRQTQMRMLEARLNGGQAKSLDVLEATRRYLEVTAERARMADNQNISLRQLTKLMGAPAQTVIPGSRFPIAGFSQIEFTPANITELQVQALGQRADLEAVYWQWRAALAALAESRTLDWPWLSFIQGSLGVSDDGSATTTEHAWRVDLGVNIPLFATLNDTTAARAEKVRQCEVQLQAVQNQILDEVRDALEAVKQAADRIHGSEENTAVVTRMQQLLADMSARPEVSAMAVADLKESIARSQSVLLAAQFEHRKSLLELEAALGVIRGTGAPGGD